MLEKFSTETLEAIFDTLPVDVTFVDEADTARYYSKGDDRIFRRTPASPELCRLGQPANRRRWISRSTGALSKRP